MRKKTTVPILPLVTPVRKPQVSTEKIKVFKKLIYLPSFRGRARLRPWLARLSIGPNSPGNLDNWLAKPKPWGRDQTRNRVQHTLTQFDVLGPGPSLPLVALFLSLFFKHSKLKWSASKMITELWVLLSIILPWCPWTAANYNLTFLLAEELMWNLFFFPSILQGWQVSFFISVKKNSETFRCKCATLLLLVLKMTLKWRKCVCAYRRVCMCVHVHV